MIPRDKVTTMKAILKFLIVPLALFVMGQQSLWAMPKYTDRETALALAKVLDKGRFDRYTISSTYVQNKSSKDYYISVILSNGTSHKWTIRKVYEWSRDDKLHLSRNRTLLFLDPRSTKFVLLDKNDFHRQALKSNVYEKIYGAGDPLEGRKFRFHIKSFNLIGPRETAFGRDRNGSKYRYVVDLYNGLQELLTYEDAYSVMKAEQLKVEKQSKLTTFGRAYHVTKILSYPKGEPEMGVAQFGIEIQFDQNIQLVGDQFPVEIYEKWVYDPYKRKNTKRFVMDITIPNSEKINDVKPVESLEYLHNVHITKSSKYKKRLYLRAEFNPNVMDIPPLVYKNSDNSVYVNFFHMIDQSVMSRGMLLEDAEIVKAQKSSKRQIRVKKAIKRDSDFGRAFIAALETQKQSQAIKDANTRIEKLLEGIRQFEEAALYAEKDSQLYNALHKRNELRETVIILVVDSVKSALNKEGLGGANGKTLIDQLDLAESFTDEGNTVRAISELREKLIAAQR